MYPNLIENYGAAARSELRKTIVQTKQQVAPTKGSLKSGVGARGEAGRLAGLEIPFKNGVPHGETGLDVLNSVTSFEGFVPPPSDKMYVGLTQTGFTVEFEYFHEKDATAGYLPETRFDQRDQMMRTYMQHHNWYMIGEKYGTLAIVTVGGGNGATLTLAGDNTARGRSKGGLRLAVSASTTAGKRIMYQSYTTSTDVLTATFYITSRASSTQVVIAVTDAGTVVAGDHIVKLGHYKRVPYGLGYHINQANRIYQGVNTTTYTMFNSRRVNGGNALVTPTLMDTAKGAKQTRANDVDAGRKAICHLTMGNYKTLASFGYALRVYNAEKGDADTTFGLPNNFEDEDCIFIQDADFEDAYIYIRPRRSYFEYRQASLDKASKGDGTQYVGVNSLSQGRGSTEFYDNYVESYNLAWDARGEDGMNKDGAGSPNSSVCIDNLEIPAVSQLSEGIALV